MLLTAIYTFSYFLREQNFQLVNLIIPNLKYMYFSYGPDPFVDLCKYEIHMYVYSVDSLSHIFLITFYMYFKGVKECLLTYIKFYFNLITSFSSLPVLNQYILINSPIFFYRVD